MLQHKMQGPLCKNVCSPVPQGSEADCILPLFLGIRCIVGDIRLWVGGSWTSAGVPQNARLPPPKQRRRHEPSDPTSVAATSLRTQPASPPRAFGPNQRRRHEPSDPTSVAATSLRTQPASPPRARSLFAATSPKPRGGGSNSAQQGFIFALMWRSDPTSIGQS
ncbi:hypothetical protein T484DRAFT_3509804 [Baffinella frigidus]|nr:hypothetical protein T484DRAFT_3509804 [Cryptophyta sp. CCMP2293]